MKNIILVLIFVFVASSVYAIETPDLVLFNAKNGVVTFNHGNHSKTIECAKCHHTDEMINCSTCHGVDTKAPSMKKALHKNCKGCHKSLKQGPTKCKACHVK